MEKVLPNAKDLVALTEPIFNIALDFVSVLTTRP